MVSTDTHGCGSYMDHRSVALTCSSVVDGRPDRSDVELVVPHFMLESGGKVPRKICAKVDEYLRKQIKAGASGALVSLSYPTEKEEQLRRQL